MKPHKLLTLVFASLAVATPVQDHGATVASTTSNTGAKPPSGQVHSPVGSEPGGTDAVNALVQRRLPPSMRNQFNFVLQTVQGTDAHDAFTVTVKHQHITVTSGTTSGLTRGLLEYLRTLGGDTYWSGDTFDNTMVSRITDTQLSGSSWAEMRHCLNVVTYSYSTAFYDWTKWEYLIDWMALHGYNLPLAPGGQEYVIAEMLRNFGLSDDVVLPYISGPAFHGWSRQGNIRGTWGGTTSQDWLNKQWDLQTKIISRMVALGMTPVLPGWSGYVPAELQPIVGGHEFKKASQWMKFPLNVTANSAIDPNWDTWFTVEKKFIDKQRELYGGWTSSHYNIDLFTEMAPSSTEVAYLHNISTNVMTSLQQADANAVWVLNGWFMVNDPKHWTSTAVEAFIGNLPINSSLVLDLATESYPQWSRLSNFHGRRWIWNTLVNYGQNNGMFGRLQQWCNDIINAKKKGGNIVGQGITMEGINNNEHLFELATDQAWQPTPINLPDWTTKWIQRRYRFGKGRNPQGGDAEAAALAAWVLLDSSVYNAPSDDLKCTTRSIFDIVPDVSGITNVTGNYLATKITYNTDDVVAALDKMLVAAQADKSLGAIPGFRYDIVDVARQALFNGGINLYLGLIQAWNTSDSAKVESYGKQIVELMHDIDDVVATDPNFQLSTWVNDARAWGNDAATQDFMEFQARNQITIWGPLLPFKSLLDRYAAKHWTGVVGDVFGGVWELFYKHLLETPPAKYKYDDWTVKMLAFEGQWDMAHLPNDQANQRRGHGHSGDAISVIQEKRTKWRNILGQRVY